MDGAWLRFVGAICLLCCVYWILTWWFDFCLFYILLTFDCVSVFDCTLMLEFALWVVLFVVLLICLVLYCVWLSDFYWCCSRLFT